MKKRGIILAAALLGIVAFWHKVVSTDPTATSPAASRAGASAATGFAGPASDPVLPTKSGDRPAVAPRPASHAPERLREFYLPEVDIDGLTLEVALRKLLAAYEDVCRETGESPLRLTFTVPPGNDRRLTLKLGAKTLDASIRLLASVSGLMVARKGSEYVFEAPEETGASRTISMRVPPDFFNAPQTKEDPFIAAAPPSKISPAAYFASKDFKLDPATRLRYSPATGCVIIDTTSAADEVAVRGWIDSAASETPLQHKLETRVLEIKAGNDWMPPDFDRLDEDAMQRLIHELAEQEGAQVATMPAITARSGETANMQIGSELITPVAGRTDEFESHWLGKNLDLRPVPLGFGHRVDLRFTDTAVNPDSAAGAPVIDELTDIQNTSFTSDHQARLHVQTKPDGTRTVVLVTPTLIDATGRPVHGGE